MPEVVTTHRPPEAVREIVESIGPIISGIETSDPHGIHQCFWGAFAYSLAESVHKAFIAKSNHESDELGLKWPDLEDKTKAYSRKDARRGLTLHRGKPTEYGNTHRPTLTKEQDAIWRAIFVKKLAYNNATMSSGAEESAAASAWAILKKMGATTILDYAKDRSILLLQKSGRLEKSLRPGDFSGDKYNPPTDQVFRIDQSALTWGSAVSYAERVSQKRPLWPKDISRWIDRAVEFAIKAVITKIRNVV